MQKETEGKVLAYRVFRLRHSISLRELAEETGVSAQRISRIELLETPVTQYTKRLLTMALERVIERRSRELRTVWQEFDAARAQLFEEVREARHE